MYNSSNNIYLEELRFHGEEKNLTANICFCYFPEASNYREVVEYLHPQERKYFNTLKFEKRIKSYTIGRYAAKRAVGAFTGEEKLEDILIQQGIFNQPIVTCQSKQNVHVSISHSDDFGAAVAFSEAYPIGIDLERIDVNRINVLDKQLTETEKVLVRESTRLYYSYAASLTLFWTAKEALSKVLKTGLLTPLNIYEITELSFEQDYFLSTFKNFPQYYTISFQVGNYICSLTCPGKIEMVSNILNLKKRANFIINRDDKDYQIAL